MINDLGNRRGIVTFSQELVSTKDGMDAALEVMAKMFPVKVEFNYNRRGWDILGVSNDFDEVPEGSCAPRYDALLAYRNSIGRCVFTGFRKA